MKICILKNFQFLIIRQGSKNKTVSDHWIIKIKLFVNKFFFKSVCNRKGQVIVEYILLLLVSTVMALALLKLVSVVPGDNSPVFKYWENLLKAIGQDIST